MTHWWSKDNYGQQLQCYAMQKYLRDSGHDAYLIRYNANKDYIPTPIWKKIPKALNPIKLYEFLAYKKRVILNAKDTRNDERKFEDFRAKHIKQSEKVYYYYEDLRAKPPEADIYIVGSDQVWNPSYLPSVERQGRAFFLDFGDQSTKRISYAASFGKEKLDNSFINVITPLLQKFNYVSVREKSGLNICKQCGINNAEWVPDPTMLLEADVYRTLYENEPLKKTDERYCFLYYLGNKCDVSVKTVYAWAKKKNLTVIYVSANSQIDKYKKTYATIPEWIYLLEHAEYVITNSYHCGIFSLIFEKKFGIMPLSGTHVGMNSRFESLFEQLKTGKRFLDSEFSILDKKIDWQSVSKKIQVLRESCKLFEYSIEV